MSAFDVAKKYLEPDGDVTEGRILAVLIDSPIVGPVWFAQSDDFKSGDRIPVFFMSEVPHLNKMEPAELRRRYVEKLALGGGRILTPEEAKALMAADGLPQ
jgi:hypothetical protein